MKEQIEEIQNTLITISKHPIMIEGLEHWADVIAEELYNAGYRKQKENTVELPCKVGDLLYMPWKYDGVSGVAVLGVTYMVVDKDELRIMTDFSSDDEEYFDLYFGGKFVPSDFGKTVFLTREEAEKALAKMKGGAE